MINPSELLQSRFCVGQTRIRNKSQMSGLCGPISRWWYPQWNWQSFLLLQYNYLGSPIQNNNLTGHLSSQHGQCVMAAHSPPRGSRRPFPRFPVSMASTPCVIFDSQHNRACCYALLQGGSSIWMQSPAWQPVEPLLYCPLASAEPIYIGAGESASEGHRPDLLQDVPDQGHHMLTSRAHVPGLASGSDCKIWSILPLSRFPVKIPMTNIPKTLFQLPHIYVGGGMLFNHLKYSMVLQVGIHVATSPTEVCDVLLGTLGGLVGSVFSSLKKQGAQTQIFQEALWQQQTSYVSRRCAEWMSFSRLFRCWLRDLVFFWHFHSWNRECRRIGHLHPEELLPEDAVVTLAKAVTMLWGYSLGGKVQWLSTSISSRSSPWDVYVKDCVSSLHLGFRIPTLWASSLVISTTVNQKKVVLTVGTKPSPTVTRERLQCFIPFSACSRDCSTWLHKEGLHSPWGHTYSVKDWSHLYEPTCGWGTRLSLLLPCFLRIWETGPFRVITRRYVLSFKKPTDRRQQGKRIPSWMSKRPVFCSFLKRLHDDHRYSADPFCTCRVQNYWWKAKKQTVRELSRKTPDSMGAKLLIASTASRAFRNRHLGTLMRCCEAWEPVGKCFDPISFECVDFQRLSQIIANLARENLAEREAEITNLPWTQTEKDNALARCRVGHRAWRAKKTFALSHCCHWWRRSSLGNRR